MTALWQQVSTRIAGLPEKDQDRIASMILDELDADAGWDQAFAGSADALAQLAAEALAEHRAGQTRPPDPESL